MPLVVVRDKFLSFFLPSGAIVLNIETSPGGGIDVEVGYGLDDVNDETSNIALNLGPKRQ